MDARCQYFLQRGVSQNGEDRLLLGGEAFKALFEEVKGKIDAKTAKPCDLNDLESFVCGWGQTGSGDSLPP